MHELQQEVALDSRQESCCFVRVGEYAGEVWRAVRLVDQFVRRDCCEERLCGCTLHVVLVFEKEQTENAAREFLKKFDWNRDVRRFTTQGDDD